MRRSFIRWRYIVDWKLQGGLVAHGVVCGTAVLLAVVFGVFSPLLWSLGDDVDSIAAAEHSIVMLYLHQRFWWVAGACLFMIVLGAIRFSHRVAGPMVRFKRNLRLLADGAFTPALRTRRSDYLKDEVECLNEAVQGVAERVEAIRRAQLELRRELTAALDRDPARAEDLAPLVACCEQLEENVRAFRHTDPGDELRPDWATANVEQAAQAPVGGA